AGRGEGIYRWNGGYWDFVGNTSHFEVPDYGNEIEDIAETEIINDTIIGRWTAYESGFVICTWGTGVSGDTGVWIDNVKVIGSNYTKSGSGSIQKAMVPIAVGQELTVKSPVDSDIGATFYPLLFTEKQADKGYSFNEIKTNDVWLDGKPIYKRTVYHQDYTPPISNTNVLVPDVFPNKNDIDKILKLEGYGYLPNYNNRQIGFIGTWIDLANDMVLAGYYKREPNNITFELRNVSGKTVNDFTVTLYYTKTND
ncbi:MAG: hypothetical protein LBQ84_00705, partial [Flavobacteriaceae bacterium]|nr:hypothetical protein [Flavobacteriaceae bacterium]